MQDTDPPKKLPQGWMISCPEATRLSSERLDRRLGGWELARHRFHLLICVMCRRYARQMGSLRKLLHHHGDRTDGLPEVVLSEEFKKKLRDRMRD